MRSASSSPNGDLETLQAGPLSGPEQPPGAALGPGSALGRYIVLGRVGAGSMGVVYSAYDQQLDRRIAVKVLRRRSSGTPLLAEAKVLARLNHPNIVTVHDVGEVGGSVFVAMEFVDGATLSQWLTGNRTREAVLEVLRGAGAGLAAAHREGVIHGDFKPDNVMVSAELGVRVMDFGLARLVGESTADTAPDDVPSSLRGTPAYMAPELFWGGEATARTDVYSFAASAWEALYGERPFVAGTVPALAEAVTSGRRPEPPSEIALPRRLRRALDRGLAREPDDRWPSMDALLAELVDNAARGRRRVVVTTAAFAGLAAGSAALLWQPERPCQGARRHWDGVWDDAARERALQAIAEVELPFAEETASKVSAEFDAYVNAWVGMHNDACEATAVRGEQSAEALDLRMQCLERSRRAAKAVAALLREPDEEVVETAVLLANDLPPIERCGDVEGLRAEVPPPDPELRADVDAARATLAEAHVLTDAGRFDEAVAITGEIAESDLASRYPPLRALALRTGATGLGALGRWPDAQRAAREGYDLALRWGLWDLAIPCANLAASHKAQALEDFGGATVLVSSARALAARSGDPVHRAEVERAHARVLIAQAKHTEALAAFRLAERILKEDDDSAGWRRRANLHGEIGSLLGRLARWDEATAELDEMTRILVEAVGGQHAEVAATQNRKAGLLIMQSRFDEAAELLASIRAALELTYGPDHPNLTLVLANQAVALTRMGKAQEAEALLRRVVAAFEETHGVDHRVVFDSRNNLGGLLMGQERFEEAKREYAAVLAYREARLEAGHPDVARARANLGRALNALGQKDEAMKALKSSVHQLEAALGPDHPDALHARSLLEGIRPSK